MKLEVRVRTGDVESFRIYLIFSLVPCIISELSIRLAELECLRLEAEGRVREAEKERIMLEVERLWVQEEEAERIRQEEQERGRGGTT